MNLKMKSHGILPIVTLLFAICSALYLLPDLQPNAYAEDPVVSQETIDFMTKTSQAMAEVAEIVKPSIVNISTTRTMKMAGSPGGPLFDDPFFRRFFGDRFKHPNQPREFKKASLGSGVVVSADGYILTNNHVIKGADEINVLLPDKKQFKGKVIGTDPKTDLSVIKIAATDLKAISWGDSDKLKVGELVLAIGSPYGLNQTVTMGIVSAVGRANVGIAEYEDFIQTDAAINPGNSGGALVNAKAELVGINTAIFSRTGGYQGIGFAIPSNMAKTVIDSLITQGKVIRGWLGVSVQPITSELARQFELEEEFGALVADVVEGSPAEQAGILRGDVIVDFNNEKVEEPYNLRNTVASTHPGDSVDLTVIRNGKYEKLTVIIGELPGEAQAPQPTTDYKNALKGVSVQNLTPAIYQQLDLPERIKGVVISGVKAGSPAETRLLMGDVILEINRQAVSGLEDYESVVSKIKPNEEVLLLVFRKGSTVFITITPN
ncbi:putative periplasmic serine endoprotease DegP-like precursor [bacterium BMS3Abin10]|nr:putative periplasmic serine endoprotease DegP-like precursor [bacterium BMS3Abin10]GBE38094.1 putative periplasmic serine endoprotease DegP-like precursor [bacterium BMS3Bbin08]